MTETILLTGGFGNIGGRLAHFLTEAHSGQLRLATRQDRRPPIWSPTAQVVTCDVTNADSLRRATENVTTIFHLASLNDRECLKDPRRAHEVNVTGTANLVEAAISNGVAHIVYMSTIHVYGSPLTGLFDESSHTDPTHPYGRTHLDAERVLSGRSSEVRSTIIRSGNGFGYPMTTDVDIWHILVNDLCIQAVRTQRLALKSPSNVQRNFVTLRDICRAMHYFGILSPPNQGSIVYNLGSKKSRTLREMAELIADRCNVVLGYRPEIEETVPNDERDMSLSFDCTRIQNSGFMTQEHFADEIDGVLRLVKAVYG